MDGAFAGPPMPANELERDGLLNPQDVRLIERAHGWLCAFLKAKYGDEAALPTPRFTYLEAYLLICQLQTVREVYHVDADADSARYQLVAKATRAFEGAFPPPLGGAELPDNSLEHALEHAPDALPWNPLLVRASYWARLKHDLVVHQAHAPGARAAFDAALRDRNGDAA